MTERDTDKLTTRLQQLKKIVSEQMSISKSKRDMQLINDTYARIHKIEGWLGKEHTVKKNEEKPRQMSKKEFKEKLHEVFGVEDPKEEMTIDTVVELREVWPKIRGRNIQIKAPKEVLAEARRLQREDLKRKRKR